MKKLFTLALTLFTLNAAFSQAVVSRVSVQTPDFGFNYNRHYIDNYSSYSNNRIYQIEKINTLYEQQMHEVMRMPVSMGRKNALIRRLQREKARKLKHVNKDHYGYNTYNNREYNGNKW